MRNTVRRWRRWVFRVGAGFIAGTLVVLGSALLTPENATDCQGWRDRRSEHTSMTPTTLRTLRAGTPVHETPDFLSASLFPEGFGGFALPSRVILSSHLGDEIHIADREHLIWHELVHVEQMRQEGTLRFALVYVTDWVRGRWSGCGSFAAYEAIRYEREAELYALAMGVAEWVHTTPQGQRYAPHSAHTAADTGSTAGVATASYYQTVELSVLVGELLEAGFR